MKSQRGSDLYEQARKKALAFYLERAQLHTDEFLADETANLLWAWDWTIERGDKQGIAELWHLLHPFLRKQGYWSELISRTQASLARLPDEIESFDILLALGNLFLTTGAWQEAHSLLSRCLEIGVRSGETACTIRASRAIGVLHLRQGRWEEAIACFECCRDAAIAIDSTSEKGRAILQLAIAHRLQEDFAKSRELFDEAQQIIEGLEPPNLKLMASLYNSIGNLHLAMNQPSQALELYRAALDIRERLSNKYEVGVCLNNIAGARAKLGELDKAIELWRNAERIYESLGATQALVVTWGAMGSAYAQVHQYKAAERLLHRSIQAAEEEGAPHRVVAGCEKLGRMLLSQGDAQAALDVVEKAFKLATSTSRSGTEEIEQLMQECKQQLRNGS